MFAKPAMCATLTSAILTLWIAPTPSQAADRLVLDRCCIVADPGQPSYVQYGVEDLAGYLTELTGNKVPVGPAPDDKACVRIDIGPNAIRDLLTETLPAEKLGDEGYLLRSVSKDGADHILAAGATPRGTKAAIAALMKAIRYEGKSACIETPLNATAKPSFAKRGMHFNGWPFNYPYTFRSWREEDWKRYIDILAYQQINLFYLWPFIEIMPVPLSKEDQEYLEECRRVVDYAQQKHGMEVWIMQCTNRVAKDRCGVDDPRRRPYWRPSQEDLNPGKPEDFQAIMASREAMYRILNDVDGVCNIDSDPGHYPGSPLSDYIKVLQGCRALLDRHNLHGKQTKLINWMWVGWGTDPNKPAFDVSHQALTLQTLKQELAEPWWLVNGVFRYLPVCREAGLLPKTVLLPYGVIEGEPAYPGTNVRIDEVRKAFDDHIVKYPELAGVMGNAQTPLLQFPHVYFYTSSVWDLDYRKHSEQETLHELAAYLYPEHKDLIANSYLALKETDPANIETLTARLNDLVNQNQLGQPGLFGRKLFPDPGIVARMLALQLRLRAAQQRLFADVDSVGSDTPYAKLVQEYCEACTDWDNAHGWSTLWGWKNTLLRSLPEDPKFLALAGKLRKTLGGPAGVEACFDQISATLTSKYGNQAIHDECIVPLKKAVLAVRLIDSLAQKAQATASVAPDRAKYPPSAAIDGNLGTLYWPGALTKDNTEWLQLAWDKPQTFRKVSVHFLHHRSMTGRTIHLQKEVSAGNWEDFATAVIPNDPKAPHSVATFQLPAPVTLDRIRVVNLLDLFEIEVRE